MLKKPAYTRADLQSILFENIAEITFTKTDGSTRVMVCTLMPVHLPPLKVEYAQEEPELTLNQNILAVWDVQKKDWRSFRIDSITKEVEIKVS